MEEIQAERALSYRGVLLLLGICLLSLSVRVWLLDQRWINPDEGAHLMDAAFALDGKIPNVDYQARQPLYVYALAGVLKLFGINYISGRLLPVTCSMLTGIVVFLLARVLFDEKVALLSGSVYWILPLEVVNSPIVKIEPLAVLLTSLSLYAVARNWRSNDGLWLVIAGGCAAMGYYVRESALMIPLMVGGFLVVVQEGRIRKVASRLGLFLAGYGAVFAMVLIFYSRWMGLHELLLSSLNPVGFLAKVTTPTTPSAGGVSWDLYYHYLLLALDLHSFLIIALVFSVGITLRDLLIRSQEQGRREYVLSHWMLYLWVFFLFIAYAYYFHTRGFFIDYFREFLPPLVIIFAAFICRVVPALESERALNGLVLGGLSLGAIWLLMQATSEGTFLIGIGVQASVGIALFTLVRFSGAFASSIQRLRFVATLLALVGLVLLSRHPAIRAYLPGALVSLGVIAMIFGVTWRFLKDRVPFGIPAYLRYLSLSIVVACYLVSISYSTQILSVRYDSVWSPEAVAAAASYLTSHTTQEDEVLSGAAIWEFQALRRPYQAITHPLSMEYPLPEQDKEKLRLAIVTRPPKVIILDGYTQRTYIRQVPEILDLLQSRYELKATAAPARYPVRVYHRKEIGAS